ncbi:hypothetical protein [Streptomyces violens]|uniref:hypothetical protein n=1 Tax=Streptomyces violens TaxID=66377 RepID=UPI0004C021EF|nr:hypothetical protein [Streptomyces violens]
MVCHVPFDGDERRVLVRDDIIAVLLATLEGGARAGIEGAAVHGAALSKLTMDNLGSALMPVPIKLLFAANAAVLASAADEAQKSGPTSRCFARMNVFLVVDDILGTMGLGTSHHTDPPQIL